MLNSRLSLACISWLMRALAMSFAQSSRAASASSYLERGNGWASKGEYQRAIEDYSLGLSFAPTSADLLYCRGVAHVRVGELAEAEADFSRALKLNPQMAEVWVDRGYVLALN